MIKRIMKMELWKKKRPSKGLVMLMDCWKLKEVFEMQEGK